VGIARLDIEIPRPVPEGIDDAVAALEEISVVVEVQVEHVIAWKERSHFQTESTGAVPPISQLGRVIESVCSQEETIIEQPAIPASNGKVNPLVETAQAGCGIPAAEESLNGLPEVRKISVRLSEDRAVLSQTHGKDVIQGKTTSPDVVAKVIEVPNLKIWNRREKVPKHPAGEID
jgi:hypothetical protein